MNKATLSTVLLLLAGGSAAHAADAPETTMCNTGETVVFSCHVAKKIVSLCHPAKAPHDLSYRYGLPGHAELVYPDAEHHEKAEFFSSSSMLYGGGSQAVAFDRGDYEYGVYSLMTRSDDGNGADGADRVPVFEDGLVVSHAGKVVKKSVCSDSGLGYRDSIDWIKEK